MPAAEFGNKINFNEKILVGGTFWNKNSSEKSCKNVRNSSDSNAELNQHKSTVVNLKLTC